MFGCMTAVVKVFSFSVFQQIVCFLGMISNVIICKTGKRLGLNDNGIRKTSRRISVFLNYKNSPSISEKNHLLSMNFSARGGPVELKKSFGSRLIIQKIDCFLNFFGKSISSKLCQKKKRTI